MPTEYNPQLVDNMSAKFRRLNNPAHAMADAISMLQMFPALRGLWPGSAIGASGQMLDLAGNGLHLTNINNTLFGRSGIAPAAFIVSASTNYFTRTDEAAFDIIGTEAYLPGSLRGLTMGGWFWFDTLTASTQYAAMAKWGASITSASYLIDYFNGPRFLISDGSSSVLVSSTTLSTGQWYFLVGRYDPGSEVKLWINRDTYTNSTGVFASLNNSSSDFRIGAKSDASARMDGRASLCFLSAAAIPDDFINTYFQFTAPLFGVDV